MKKKIVALALVFCLSLAIGVGGTLAYLTSTTRPVTNTFTVGNVSASLDEAKVNEYGEMLKKDTNPESDEEEYVVTGVATAAERVEENTYKLIPGHTYVKDPTVHIDKGSENCYLFVKVENGIAAIEDSASTVASQMTAKGWTQLTDAEGKAVDNIFVYTGGDSTRKVVTPSATAGVDLVVFENFKVKSDATSDSLKGLEDAKITVRAFAVQADGFDGATMTDYVVWTDSGLAAKAVTPETPVTPAE